MFKKIYNWLFGKKPTRTRKPPVTGSGEVKDSKFFPDISHHRPCNFDLFFGKDMVFKATEGNAWVDSDFAYNLLTCVDKGIDYGVYHFYRTNRTPLEQARHFISTVGLGNLKSMKHDPVVDYETTNGQDADDLIKSKPALLEFIKYVNKQTGRKMRIYTGEYLLKKINFELEFTEHTGLPWVARYGSRPTYSFPWSNMWAWQFSDNEFFSGIGGCDGNEFIVR